MGALYEDIKSLRKLSKIKLPKPLQPHRQEFLQTNQCEIFLCQSLSILQANMLFENHVLRFFSFIETAERTLLVNTCAMSVMNTLEP